jgi:ribosomal protein S6--L-glutamate ligase
MILSFHPNIVAHENILCAGRLPNEEDEAAISRAEAVILPQGPSEALYRLSRKNCRNVFPNYDARFDFPGKIGQARLFQETDAPFPATYPFENVASYEKQFKKKIQKSPVGFPCVFKSDWGGEGEGVFLPETPDALQILLERARRAEKSGQTGFLLQQHIPTRGQSLRIVAIDRKILSYWRIQQDPTQFGTSVRAGAAINHHADPELQQAGKSVVKDFCLKTGVNLAGFDLIFPEDEKRPRPLFLEINYFFGRRGLGGSLRYYEMMEDAVREWLARLGLSL